MGSEMCIRDSYSTNPVTGAALTPSGSQALLEDRGAVYFTFKTTL